MNKKLKFIIPVSLALVIGIIVIGYTNCKSNTEQLVQETYIFKADYPVYDEDSIVKESDVIITGKVVKVKECMEYQRKIELDESLSEDEKKKILEEMNVKPLIFTVSEIEVDQVIKGEFKKGQIIKIKQLGGTLNNMKVIGEEEIYKEGSHKVFFLKDFRAEFGENMPFSTLNPIQGDIDIINGKIKNNEKVKNDKHLKIVEDGVPVETFVKNIKKKVK
ncbi:MAG TPA: hypothetical protein GX727_07490 [Clostridium sp.]|nr:hypothetical protein [Clostridium sp.]